MSYLNTSSINTADSGEIKNNLKMPKIRLKPMNNLVNNQMPGVKLEIKQESNVQNGDLEESLNYMDDDTDTICGDNRDEEILNDMEYMEHILDSGLIDPKTEFINETNFGSAQQQQVESVEIRPNEGQENNQNLQVSGNEVPYLTFKSDDSLEILYKSRLEHKVHDARESISKFAEHIKYQHEPLMHIIGTNEKKYNGFFCKFDTPRQCPIEKALTGHWKLKLDKMVVAYENSGTNLTPENSKIVWTIRRSNEFVKSENEDATDLPPYIQQLIKFFEDFLNNSPAVQREASRDPNATKKQKKEFYEIHLRSCYQHKIMAIVVGNNVTEEMSSELRNYFNSDVCPNLVSMYMRTVNGKQKSTDFLFGERNVTEVIGNIVLKITPVMNFYSNVAGVELLSETIYEIIKSYNYDTLLLIGCGIGLINLLLAPLIPDIIGIDDQNSVKIANGIRCANKINNVRYVESSNFNKINMIFKELKNKKFVTVINNNSNDGRSPSMIERCHKILSLKHIVVLSSFQMTHCKALDKFFEPLDNEMGYPFLPIWGCVVDPTPASKHFQAMVLLERTAIVKFSQNKENGAWYSRKKLIKREVDNSELTYKDNELQSSEKRDISINNSSVNMPNTSIKREMSKQSFQQNESGSTLRIKSEFIYNNIIGINNISELQSPETSHIASNNHRQNDENQQTVSDIANETNQNKETIQKLRLMDDSRKQLRQEEDLDVKKRKEKLMQVMESEKKKKGDKLAVKDVKKEKEPDRETGQNVFKDNMELDYQNYNKNVELHSSKSFSNKNSSERASRSLMKIVKHQEEIITRFKGLINNNVSKIDPSIAKKMTEYLKSIHKDTKQLECHISSELNSTEVLDESDKQSFSSQNFRKRKNSFSNDTDSRENNSGAKVSKNMNYTSKSKNNPNEDYVLDPLSSDSSPVSYRRQLNDFTSSRNPRSYERENFSRTSEEENYYSTSANKSYSRSYPSSSHYDDYHSSYENRYRPPSSKSRRDYPNVDNNPGAHNYYY